MKQFDGLAVSSFGNIENSLSSAITRTKDFRTAFSDLTSSVLADISKMGVRMAITGPLAKMLGGAVGGGGADGSTFMPSASFMDHGFGFATGGYTGPGGRTEPAGIVHRGEYVIPAPVVSRIGVPALNRLRGYADGGFVEPSFHVPSMAPMPRSVSAARSGGPVTVTINGVIPADTKATATASRDASGGTNVVVQLQRMQDDTNAGLIASGQSATNSAMERRYGLTPRL
jgi:lambda family phage tail tape measure protein